MGPLNEQSPNLANLKMLVQVKFSNLAGINEVCIVMSVVMDNSVREVVWQYRRMWCAFVEL